MVNYSIFSHTNEILLENSTEEKNIVIKAYEEFDWDTELIEYDKNNPSNILPRLEILDNDLVLLIQKYDDLDDVVYAQLAFPDSNIVENDKFSLKQVNNVISLFIDGKISEVTLLLNPEKIKDTIVQKENHDFIEDKKSLPISQKSSENIPVEKTKSKSSVNNFIYYIIGGGVVIIILFLLYIYVFKDNKESSISDTKPVNTITNNKSNTTTSKSDNQNQNTNSEINKFQANIKTPDGVVIKFLESLGKKDFSAAFALMTEKRRGSYSNFSSTKGYGGITKTTINSCSYTGETNGKKEVKVDYESIDPSNKSGRFKQYFYLIPFNDSYLISEIKNIDIEWY